MKNVIRLQREQICKSFEECKNSRKKILGKALHIVEKDNEKHVYLKNRSGICPVIRNEILKNSFLQPNQKTTELYAVDYPQDLLEKQKHLRTGF